jgi:hypothetical protein
VDRGALSDLAFELNRAGVADWQRFFAARWPRSGESIFLSRRCPCMNRHAGVAARGVRRKTPARRVIGQYRQVLIRCASDLTACHRRRVFL